MPTVLGGCRDYGWRLCLGKSCLNRCGVKCYNLMLPVTSAPHLTSAASRSANPRGRLARTFWLAGFLVLVALTGGCRRLHHASEPDTVYVVSRQTWLLDRVAPVAVHTAQVTNGERLKVLDHQRRFYHVKTAQGQVGWIEDHFVIDQPTYDQFMDLRRKYAHTPAVSKAKIYDVLYMHVKPGRGSDRFYLLPPKDKLDLLARVSAPRPNTVPPRLEDWWLARDTAGRVGWVLSGDLDLDAPNQIVAYAQGPRMVGAYLLDTVHDPERNQDFGEYVTVLNPYKQGLPYDFDLVRVFIYNPRHHRYETAFWKRDIEGYFPVEITHESLGKGIMKGEPVPVFSIRVATSDALKTDPETGALQPVDFDVIRYALEGNIVRQISPDTGKSPISPNPDKLRKKPHTRGRHGRVRGGG